MTSKLKDIIAHQLRLPTKSGLSGWFIKRVLESQNALLEKNAAQLCAIQPHHKVLEVGFGPGIGLQHALQYVKDGPGKLYGADISEYMVEQASARLHGPILDKKIELSLASVMDLPYATDTFDRVFHCNCYYFWPSMQDALKELYRVMKPGAVMVTTINLKNVQKSKSRGLLKYGNPDPVRYMCALELTGFKDVRIKYFKDGAASYEAIFAHLLDKPEVKDR